MRKITALVLVAAASTMLSACGGGGLFNRDRPDEFAAHVVNLLQTPLLRDTIGKGGRCSAEQKYDWQHIYRSWDSVYGQA